MRSNTRATMLATLTLASVAMLVIVVTGCGSAGESDPAALEGSWVLRSFGGTNALTPAAAGVTTELTLAAGKASGNGGVNSFSGSYEAKGGDSLTFGPLASTQMAGEPAAMEQESAFFKALEDTRHFEINAGELVLSDLGNNTLAILAPK